MTANVFIDLCVLTAVTSVMWRGVVWEICIYTLEESTLSLFGIEDCCTVKMEAADSSAILVAVYSASQPKEARFEYPFSDHQLMPIIPTFI